ncbi:hypothetical protein BAUCODRAFT_33697 [Baudoinia panamericana UAMH 10762]|uniref:Major royal jelly protein n=1 Tax=Baudoinia panamericana (strain UAMH 10762) TaxID=717646 RepID=M2NB42_BAUPA|nr:uncharacterized protein BAUCODRAFT_33697 [Baudoinia panamericana UAMH 10762]EMC96369.1 hypothetical protein BAUCODRAFT_33697 [Baudoinia panamericana UAMH 10762]
MHLSALLTACSLAGVGYSQVIGQDTISTAGLIQNNATSANTRLRYDNGTYGPAVEEVHYYNGQWPIGIAVASDGRIFTSYTRGSYNYTLGVVTNLTAEAPYPNAALNLPPSALNTTWNGIAFGSGNASAFISVQALYITSNNSRRPETLWVLDTGRPTVYNAQGDPSMPYAQPGGPKLVAISLANNSIYQTYTFPSTVHYPDSYLNDLRFDLRTNITGTSGKGIAYLVDSSNEGRPGFIMLDLGTGISWRRLTQDQSVLRGGQDLPVYQGHPLYLRMKGMPAQWQLEGLDGIQISPDGNTVYYSPLSQNYLYSVPTLNLRAQDTDELAEINAHANVSNHGQRGSNANGFEGDSNGFIYQLIPEHNAVFYYNPRDGQTHPFVRDPRILWPDGGSIGADGYLYLNINQLPYQPDWNNGVDLRQHPGAILRVKLPNNGTKVTSLYA